MLRPRVIPCLTISGNKLVKTVRFSDPLYVGDPINAIRVFNDKEVDELVVLDIHVGKEGKAPNFELIHDLCTECFMPLAYGGGISTLKQVEQLIAMGVEKVILNAATVTQPDLIREAVKHFGSQSIVGCIDYKKGWLRTKPTVYTHSGSHHTKLDPIEHAKALQELGIGELILQSIERDGTRKGYDLELLHEISQNLQIPVVAMGGAGTMAHLKEAFAYGAAAVSGGSFFVLHPAHRAVLITYPSDQEIRSLRS